MSLNLSVRVSRWILDTYDLSVVFFFFRVVNRYFWGFISIRNQCKATTITSWTSQFHQRFNNIRNVLTKYAENCMITHRSAYVRFQGFTCQRSPTLHFGRDSHVCSPPTHATHANGRVTKSFMGGVPLAMPQKTAFLFHFLCLPCKSHNYRGKKNQVKENDRGKTFSLELGDGRVVIASKRLLAGALQAEPFFTVHMKDKAERDKEGSL